MKTHQLPYRETTNVFIINNKKQILAIDAKTFIAFPGGGLDEGEDAILAIQRETEEEIGLTNIKVTIIDSVLHDYYPAWGKQSEKNKERYKQFKGEKTYLAIGELTSKSKYNKPKDPLPNPPKWMDIKTVIDKMNQYGSHHKNEYPYKVAQLMVLNTILLLK